MAKLEAEYQCRSVFEDVAVRGKLLSDDVLIPERWLTLGSLPEFCAQLTNRYPQLSVSVTQNVIYIGCLLTNASYNRLDQPVEPFHFSGSLKDFRGSFLAYHCQILAVWADFPNVTNYNPIISIASEERLTPIQYLIGVCISNAVSWRITRGLRGDMYDFNWVQCQTSRPGQKQ